ncbi:hypothetical protein BOSE21B_110883 [Bosea sp. 21B]|nr:hypothetical protein BOSE21B_110883 [Bosea sp. 21B]CAD5276227.1 hypothetical protein BOSE7B_40333 [Bosea sp. 7B]
MTSRQYRIYLAIKIDCKNGVAKKFSLALSERPDRQRPCSSRPDLTGLNPIEAPTNPPSEFDNVPSCRSHPAAGPARDPRRRRRLSRR